MLQPGELIELVVVVVVVELCSHDHVNWNQIKIAGEINEKILVQFEEQNQTDRQ